MPLDDFIYAGTTGGNVFVTFSGGGVGTNWKSLGSPDGSPLMKIVPDPTRGSTDLYAVTANGVYYMPDSSAAAPVWASVTGTLFTAAVARSLYNDPTEQVNDLAAQGNKLALTSLAVDWRFAIPNNLADPVIVTLTGAGSTTFSYNGVAATAPLAFSATTTAAQVLTNLNTIPALNGIIQVAGVAGGPFTITNLGNTSYVPSLFTATNAAQVNVNTGATHPVLYVGSQGGVFRSLDMGTTWGYFPDINHEGAPQNGGYLPSVQVNALQLSLGNINPATGFPVQANGLNLLMAATFGRGTFAIRLDNNILLQPATPLSFYAVNPVEGPHVVSIASSGPSTPGGTDLAGITVTFNSTVDPSTFTPSKIASVTGPISTGVFTFSAAGAVTVAYSGAPALPAFNYNPATTTAAQFQAYLATIPSLSAFGNVTVTGNVGGPFTVALAASLNPTFLSVVSGPASVVLAGVQIPVSQVIDITPTPPIGQASLHNIYEILFTTPQNTPGMYRVVLGPAISDFGGDEMDQNQNFINGENPADVYTGRFLFQPFTNNAPVLNVSTATVPAVNENVTSAADPGVSVNNFVTGLTPAPGITDPDNTGTPGYCASGCAGWHCGNQRR